MIQIYEPCHCDQCVAQEVCGHLGWENKKPIHHSKSGIECQEFYRNLNALIDNTIKKNAIAKALGATVVRETIEPFL
jgi:hypothetical protein